ncbi:MAG: transcriptional repressor [Spirochaetales bacterium]|nr:transcriptional repressor [Spirochaetales bacterium]
MRKRQRKITTRGKKSFVGFHSTKEAFVAVLTLIKKDPALDICIDSNYNDNDYYFYQRRDMRTTKQRTVILEQLMTHKDHPGADIIYEEVRQILPRISLGTVYRNLELLSEAGTILKLEQGGGQKRFDPNTHPHGHFRCLTCGKIEDLPERILVPQLADSDEWLSSRKVCGINLEYTGYCLECSGWE